MSLEVNWETITSGPDGEELAERIRSFIHDKFQTVPLPRFIRSVNVHGFDFGTIPPRLDLKDITDPLPDFYEGDDDDDDEDDDEGSDDGSSSDGGGSLDNQPPSAPSPARERHSSRHHQHHHGSRGGGVGGAADRTTPKKPRAELLRQESSPGNDTIGGSVSPFLGASTPGILGGPGLSYFQGHLGGTGTHTPLAAVAGAHHLGGSGWMGGIHSGTQSPRFTPWHSRNPSRASLSEEHAQQQQQLHPHLHDPFGGGSPALREKNSVSTLGPATSVSASSPPAGDGRSRLPGSAVMDDYSSGDDDYDDIQDHDDRRATAAARDARQRAEQQQAQEQAEQDVRGQGNEPRVDDMQAVFRIQYDGDIRLNLTAEILLDYPMPSFVGIPLKLNITGLAFDGVGVLARIRRRLHFCFLSPEDALAAVGRDDDDDDGDGDGNGGKGKGGGAGAGAGAEDRGKARFGGLLNEIKVESEIGERDGGKQSLKNVGKVERFVLEQVRRIFEEEFVYPSFWTFLV